MDIDDILAEITRGPYSDVKPLYKENLPLGFAPALESGADNETGKILLVQLTRRLIAERCSPMLLPWPESLIRVVMGLICRQVEYIQELSCELPDQSATNLLHTNTISAQGQSAKSFALVVLGSDLERWRWLVRIFVRARWKKIVKFLPYYAKLVTKRQATQSLSRIAAETEHVPTPQVGTSLYASSSGEIDMNDNSTNLYAQTPYVPLSYHEVNLNNIMQSWGNDELLSRSEQNFILATYGHRVKLYATSFLNALPVALRKLDDNQAAAGGINMCSSPYSEGLNDKMVIIRVLGRICQPTTKLSSKSGGTVPSVSRGSSIPMKKSKRPVALIHMKSINDEDHDMDELNEQTPWDKAKLASTLELWPGDIWILKWSIIKPLWLKGLVEVI